MSASAEPKVECPELMCAYSFVGEHRFQELLDHYVQHHREEQGGTVDVIDAAHLERQREFSKRTFGPGIRRGVVDHLRKELDEVEDTDLTDLGEWVDIIILGLDGAWRAGHEPQEIIDAIKDKQARNEQRVWPDWRTMGKDQAIEHDRGRDDREGRDFEGRQMESGPPMSSWSPEPWELR